MLESDEDTKIISMISSYKSQTDWNSAVAFLRSNPPPHPSNPHLSSKLTPEVAYGHITPDPIHFFHCCQYSLDLRGGKRQFRVVISSRGRKHDNVNNLVSFKQYRLFKYVLVVNVAVYITSKHVLLCIRDGFTLIEKSSHSLWSVPVFICLPPTALSRLLSPTRSLTLSSLYLWHQLFICLEVSTLRVPHSLRDLSVIIDHLVHNIVTNCWRFLNKSVIQYLVCVVMCSLQTIYKPFNRQIAWTHLLLKCFFFSFTFSFSID